MRRVPILALCAFSAAPAAAHEPFPWHGSEIHVLLDKDGTGGEMGMFTSRFAGPGGPPLHVHEDASEAFYLIEGSAELVSGDQRFTLEAGEVAFVPKGLDHTFHMIEEDGGKILVIVAPAGFEGFFMATRGPEDARRIGQDERDLRRVRAGLHRPAAGGPVDAPARRPP